MAPLEAIREHDVCVERDDDFVGPRIRGTRSAAPLTPSVFLAKDRIQKAKNARILPSGAISTEP